MNLPDLTFSFFNLGNGATFANTNRFFKKFCFQVQVTRNNFLSLSKRSIGNCFCSARNRFSGWSQGLSSDELSFFLKLAHPLHPPMHMLLPEFRCLLKAIDLSAPK